MSRNYLKIHDLTSSEKTEFRAGFIKVMKDVQNQKERNHKKECSKYYEFGYETGQSYWEGIIDRGCDLAADLGLIAEYKDFGGQSSFRHPIG